MIEQSPVNETVLGHVGLYSGSRASIGGDGGDASPPHFSGWGDSIGIVPPL